MGLDLASMGRAKRVIDEYARQKEGDEFQKNQRAYATEQQGWARDNQKRQAGLSDLQMQNTSMQNEDLVRQRDWAKQDRDAVAGGATFKQMAENAFRRGDMASFEKYKSAHDAGEKEGISKAVLALYQSGPIDGVSLAQQTNGVGAEKIDRYDVQDVTDENGRIIDRNVTPIKNGQKVGTFSRNELARRYGLVSDPKPFAVAEGGAAIDPTSGRVIYENKKEEKPKDSIITLKRSDGSEVALDTRDPEAVKKYGDQQAAQSGLSKDVADRLWKALPKNEFNDPEVEKTRLDGFLNAKELLRRDPTLDPETAAIYGMRMLTDPSVAQRALPGRTPAAGKSLPEVPKGAPAGAMWLEVEGRGALLGEKVGDKFVPYKTQPGSQSGKPAGSKPATPVEKPKPAAKQDEKPAEKPAASAYEGKDEGALLRAHRGARAIMDSRVAPQSTRDRAQDEARKIEAELQRRGLSLPDAEKRDKARKDAEDVAAEERLRRQQPGGKKLPTRSGIDALTPEVRPATPQPAPAATPLAPEKPGLSSVDLAPSIENEADRQSRMAAEEANRRPIRPRPDAPKASLNTLKPAADKPKPTAEKSRKAEKPKSPLRQVSKMTEKELRSESESLGRIINAYADEADTATDPKRKNDAQRRYKVAHERWEAVQKEIALRGRR